MTEAGSMLRAEWRQKKGTEGQESKRQQHTGKEQMTKGEIKLAR